MAVLGRDDAGAWALRSRVRGRLRAFSRLHEVEDGAYLRGETITLKSPYGEAPVCDTRRLCLLGQHNVLNVLAAAVLADSVGISADVIASVAASFTGVEHRLELVREVSGARWYDDSIATAPERMLAALRAFAEPIVLLAGGRDKDLPWRDAALLIRERVREVVLFGEAADLIRAHLEETVGPNGRRHGSAPGTLERIVLVDDLEQAVHAASRLARAPGMWCFSRPVEPALMHIGILPPVATTFKSWSRRCKRNIRRVQWQQYMSASIESKRVGVICLRGPTDGWIMGWRFLLWPWWQSV